MTNNPTRIGFAGTLLGGRIRTQTSFDEDDDVKVKKEDQKPVAETGTQSILKFLTPISQPDPMFKLPRLNPTQEKAASNFLNSPPNSITLVQGPPGTGTYKGLKCTKVCSLSLTCLPLIAFHYPR
jgi:hypothetical protein